MTLFQQFTALVPHFLLISLSLCMVWVIVSDASRYIIPNTLNGLILALYVLAALLLPIHPLSALAAAGIILGLGLGLFALGLMGGGDIKLLVVLSLWTGWNMATVQFIFLTAICGGVLVVLVLLLRVMMPPILFKLRPTRNLPRLLTRKQPVPYGLAIAAAFLWLLWIGGIEGVPSYQAL